MGSRGIRQQAAEAEVGGAGVAYQAVDSPLITDEYSEDARVTLFHGDCSDFW